MRVPIHEMNSGTIGGESAPAITVTAGRGMRVEDGICHASGAYDRTWDLADNSRK